MYRDWGSAVDFSRRFSPARWHWEPLLNKLLSKKLNLSFLLKNNKKLIFHLNRSFLNCLNISKNKNQPHRQFYLKVTLKTKINFTPSRYPFSLASAPSLAYLLKLDPLRLLDTIYG